MKELELFQKSCFRWIFGTKERYEQQLKKYKFLPLCYRIELLTFSMIFKMICQQYFYEFAAHIGFRVYDRDFRCQATSLFTCKYSSVTHQKSFFSRAAEMANLLYRHKIITGFDPENIRVVKEYLMMKKFNLDVVCSHYICCACYSCKYSRSVC